MKSLLYVFPTALVMLFSAAMLVRPADAANVTFAFTGVVTAVDPAVAAQFAANDTLQGSFTFNDATADTDPGDTGFYLTPYSAASVSFSNGFAASLNPLGPANQMIVDDEPGFDAFIATMSMNGPPVDGAAAEFFSITMSGPGTLLASDALPSIPPSVALASSKNGVFRFRLNGNAKLVNYNLLTLTLVPEPSALALLLITSALPLTIRIRKS